MVNVALVAQWVNVALKFRYVGKITKITASITLLTMTINLINFLKFALLSRRKMIFNVL